MAASKEYKKDPAAFRKKNKALFAKYGDKSMLDDEQTTTLG